MPQSEQTLENNLIDQLVSLGYEPIKIADETSLEVNLKRQLETLNKTTFSDTEFERILNHLGKGTVFERAKTLRGKFELIRDDGTVSYIIFLCIEGWCKNLFQVTRQITVEGTYKNRYDVTLLVNGLPLVQIELKRRGLELKEAFNQTNRYQRHSYTSNRGLFQYIQLFVISNGVNTKYYANNKRQSFKQTFYWTDVDNAHITQLEAFTNIFLEPCHMAKMITKYIVLNETDKILMILRPYQYYATEAIINRVKQSERHGYIWHTTGSGKTLTSFKASQILTSLEEVQKVIFVVDRKDLDYQTTKEFNSFSKGSVDGTDDTKMLVKQLEDPMTKLVVTTIQKLNTAITKERYTKSLSVIKDQNVVFIFDECHRTQFGDTHERIKQFFTNHQLFGFTGTPIFADNAVGNKTTKDLFDECLHKYVITDAIKDENVLKFSVEYVGRYKEKETANNIDIEVEQIDTKELLESPQRLEKIVDYIIANHNRKTHGREFTAMMCVSSVDVLRTYYELFRAKKEAGVHNLSIATIFSYTANEEDKDADGILDDPLDMDAGPVNQHSRDALESYIGDYNELFDTKFTTKDSQSYYNYYNDIAKKVKERKIDILLVVNMFLTGFDSKSLNTMYVDKNLRHHGLIQAYSRTNRILNETKSQGNIVVFRNLKKATDDAIALFSNKDAKEIIMMEPYEVYVSRFNTAVEALFAITPTVDSVNGLPDEEAELQFVTAFRELLRIKNVLESFADFTFDHVQMDAQLFEDFKSKYLDIYDKVKSDQSKEKVSVLDDIDFELELIHRDEINVTYILALLADMVGSQDPEHSQRRKQIIDILAGDAQLRSKKELIEQFIDANLPEVEDSTLIPYEFSKYWNEEKQKAFASMCEEENLHPEIVDKVIGEYLFTEREPLNEAIVEALEQKPKLLERKKIVGRVKEKILGFIEVFISGIPDDVE